MNKLLRITFVLVLILFQNQVDANEKIQKIVNWLDSSQHLSWGTWNENYTVHSTYDDEDIHYNSNASQLATLTTTSSLIKAGITVNTELCLNEAVSWVETQDFINIEYLCRQIEILSMHGINCDLLIDKLLLLKNTDGGWGEFSGFKTNSIDTIWALKALLSAGCRNDEIIGDALNIIVSYTCKIDKDNDIDYFRWSTYYSTKIDINSWYARENNVIISVYFYDLLKNYADYLDRFFPIKSYTDTTLIQNRTIIEDSIKNFLLTQLDDDSTVEDIQQDAIVTSILKKNNIEYNNVVANTSLALENLISAEPDNDQRFNYQQDPYLTSLILDCLCENEIANNVNITSLDISGNTLIANLSTSSCVSAKFYIKEKDSDKFVLFDSESNSTASDNISANIPDYIKDNDLLAVVINYKSRKEITYNISGLNFDLAVFNKDIKVYDNDGNLLEKNIILKSNVGSIREFIVEQKIYNFSSKAINALEILPNHDIINLDPNSIYIYKYTLEISSNSPEIIDVVVNLNISDSDLQNNSSSTKLYVIDPDYSNTPANNLPPSNLNYVILNDNNILLFWDAPLDANIIGYKAGTYDQATNKTTFFATVLDTSAKYKIQSLPVIFHVYSIDVLSHISTDHASLTINIANLTDKDDTSPVIEITYPLNNQLISSAKSEMVENELEGACYGSIPIYGSTTDDMFSNYNIELIRLSDGTCLSVNIIDKNKQVKNGLLAEIPLDSESITSEAYLISASAYDLAGNEDIATSITINICKWIKKFAYEGNQCQNPSWNPNTDKIIFSTLRLSELDGQNNFVNSLWQWDLTNNFISQYTFNYFNNLEPVWYESDKILFTSYREGARNIVIKSSNSEDVYNFYTDVNGDPVYNITELLDSNGNQIYFKKSFYNPDCIVNNGNKFIVASDELGELVLIKIDANNISSFENLTLDVKDNEGKKFILADNPKFGNVESSLCEILFEGYNIQPSKNYTEDYYINSDIFALTVDLSNSSHMFQQSSLKQLTNTPYESETTPVWLGDEVESSMNVSIAYITDKDINSDGYNDWNISLAGIENSTLNKITFLSNNTLSDGVIRNLDFKNFRFTFDEIFYSSSDSAVSKVSYLDLDSNLQNSVVISSASKLTGQQPFDYGTKDVIDAIPMTPNANVSFSLKNESADSVDYRVVRTAELELFGSNWGSSPSWSELRSNIDNQTPWVIYTPYESNECKYISLQLKQSGTIAGGKNVWLEIYLYIDGQTQGQPVISNKIIASNIATGGEIIDFRFSPSCIFEVNQSYLICLKGDYEISATNHIQYAHTNNVLWFKMYYEKFVNNQSVVNDFSTETPNSWSSFRYSVNNPYNNNNLARKFIPNLTGTYNLFSLKLKQIPEDNNYLPPNTKVWIEIYPDNDGKPAQSSYLLGRSDTIETSSIDTGYLGKYALFAFSQPLMLSNLNTYWIVIYGNYSPYDKGYISWGGISETNSSTSLKNPSNIWGSTNNNLFYKAYLKTVPDWVPVSFDQQNTAIIDNTFDKEGIYSANFKITKNSKVIYKNFKIYIK